MLKRSGNSFERKLKKLKNDPYLFLADSQKLKFLIKNTYIQKHLKNISSKGTNIVDFGFFENIGSNWNDLNSSKPIVFLIGFKDWKLSFLPDFLEQYRLIYVNPKTPWYIQKKHYNDVSSPKFIAWGKAGSGLLLDYVRSKELELFRMEDGFIRSIGLGADKIAPISLILDKTGIYYDASQSSDLEEILNNMDFDDVLLSRANSCIDIIKKFGVSKYSISNQPSFLSEKDFFSSQQLKNGVKKTVLVIGQVDGDASIKYGCANTYSTSHNLLLQAFFENPDAKIFYKPHPEVLKNIRNNNNSLDSLEKFFEIIENDVSIANALEGIDVVYTLTSLSGFESIIRGKDVIAVGAPFYSGWGLTQDRYKIERRQRTLDVLQVFAAAYIIYPLYVCPISKDKIQIEQALLTLCCMSSPFFEFLFYGQRSFPLDDFSFENDRNKNDLNERLALFSSEINVDYLNDFGLILHALCLSLPVVSRVEDFLLSSKNYSVCIDLFYRLISFFRKSVRFDEMKDFIDIYSEWFMRVKHDLLYHDAKKFLEYYIFSIKKMNGRIVSSHIDYYIPSDIESVEYFDLIKKQFRIFLLNCLYDRAFLVINSLYSLGMELSMMIDMLHMTYEKPVKNERNGYERERVRQLLLGYVLAKLDSLYVDDVDFLINRVICAAYGKDIDLFEKNLGALCDLAAQKNTEEMEKYAERFKKIDFTLYWISSEGRPDLADIIYDIISRFFKSTRKSRMRIDILNSKRDYNGVRLMIRNNPLLLNDKVIAQRYSKTMRALGDFEAAKKSLARSLGDTSTALRKSAIGDQIDKISFIAESSSFIDSVRLEKEALKGVVFLSFLNCLNSIAMLVPVICELKKKGFHIVCLTDCSLKIHKIGIDMIDQFDSIIPAELDDGKIQLKWFVDWKSRRVIHDGVNYYQGIYEQLSARFRRFYIDINDPSIKRVFDLQIKYADLILRVCKKINKDVVLGGIPVVFLSGNSHASPYSIFRDYCLAQDNPRLRFVAANVAYENYYSNLGGKFSGSMAVVDMTLHRTCRAPFLPIKERFDKWYSENINDPNIEYRVSKLLSANRVARENQEASPNLARVVAAKQQGTKIICCFGKILCDMAVPYDGGPAHTDIVDWLNHTIDVVKDNPDILLLIKPHPHELRTEIALDLVEFLRDVVPAILPDNVIFLDHKEFNVAEMANLLDLAVLWNGTSSLELAIMGVPVMMCGYFGRHDYPVELIYPESRSQYADYLCSLHYAKPSSEVGRRAAALLHYMGTTDVALPNRYSRRPITNDSVGVPVWDKIALQTYLSVGDPVIELAADRVIEGVRRFLG